LNRPPTYLLKIPSFAGTPGGESDDATDSCPANFNQKHALVPGGNDTGLSHAGRWSRPGRGPEGVGVDSACQEICEISKIAKSQKRKSEYFDQDFFHKIDREIVSSKIALLFQRSAA
jgi:hypothetical protein